MKEKLKKILVEVPTIVLSVIIALSINEWNIERERSNLADNVLQAMRDELRLNAGEVRMAYYYHVPLVENLIKRTHRMFSIPKQRLNLPAVTSEHLQITLTELLEQFGEVIEKPIVIKKKNDTTFSMVYKKQLLRLQFISDTLYVFGRGNISLRSASLNNNSWRIAQAAQIAPYLDFRLIRLMSEIESLHNKYQNNVNLTIGMLYKGENDITPALQDMMYYEGVLLSKYKELWELLGMGEFFI